MDEINIRDYIEVLWKRKYLIIFITLAMMLILGLPSINKPDYFEAKASVLLKNGNGAEEQGQLSQLQNILGIKSSVGGSGAFTVLLGSRAVAEKVLDKLDLRKRITGWDADTAKKQSLVSAVQSMAEFSNKNGF